MNCLNVTNVTQLLDGSGLNGALEMRNPRTQNRSPAELEGTSLPPREPRRRAMAQIVEASKEPVPAEAPAVPVEEATIPVKVLNLAGREAQFLKLGEPPQKRRNSHENVPARCWRAIFMLGARCTRSKHRWL